MHTSFWDKPFLVHARSPYPCPLPSSSYLGPWIYSPGGPMSQAPRGMCVPLHWVCASVGWVALLVLYSQDWGVSTRWWPCIQVTGKVGYVIHMYAPEASHVEGGSSGLLLWGFAVDLTYQASLSLWETVPKSGQGQILCFLSLWVFVDLSVSTCIKYVFNESFSLENSVLFLGRDLSCPSLPGPGKVRMFWYFPWLWLHLLKGLDPKVLLLFHYLRGDHWEKSRGVGWVPKLETVFCTS